MKQMTFADAEYAGKRKQRRVCNGGMAAARCSRRLKHRNERVIGSFLIDSPLSNSPGAEVGQKDMATSDHP
ncbi:hypothetical protein ACET47_11660 [Pseudomonas aeruginosa]